MSFVNTWPGVPLTKNVANSSVCIRIKSRGNLQTWLRFRDFLDFREFFFWKSKFAYIQFPCYGRYTFTIFREFLSTITLGRCKKYVTRRRGEGVWKTAILRWQINHLLLFQGGKWYEIFIFRNDFLHGSLPYIPETSVWTGGQRTENCAQQQTNHTVKLSDVSP